MLLGYVHWNAERWDSAGASFVSALEFDRRYAPAHLGLGLLPFARWGDLEHDLVEGRLDGDLWDTVEVAFAHYRAAAQYDPLAEFGPPGMPADTQSVSWLWGGPEAEALRGILAYRRRQYGRAERELTRYIRRVESFQIQGPIPEAVLWYWAFAQAQQGRFDPGVRALERLVGRSQARESSAPPGQLEFLHTNDLRYVLAWFQARAGRLSAAIRTYQEVLTHDLGYWMAHVRIAELEERYQRLDRALLERERALQLFPEDPGLIRDYGIALGKVGRLEEADSVLSVAAHHAPLDPWVWYFMGELAWIRADRDGVRVAFEQFLRLAPPRLTTQITDVSLRLESLR